MNKRILGVAGAVLAGAMAVGVVGCGIGQPPPRLPADAFVNNHPMIGPEAGQGVDHSGPLVYGPVRRPATPAAGASDDGHISDTVREVVKPPGADVAVVPGDATRPAGQPSTEPTVMRPDHGNPPLGVPVGQFQWVGCVVARVDGEPIYADKVLSTLDRALAAEARVGNEVRFREVARDLVMKQIQESIDNELEFAAAKKSLEKKDEQYAKLATAEWRKEQIRKAGGSEAKARQKAAEEGLDFEELARQQFRINMTQYYYQTKILPLVQVRAQDMRQFYQANFRAFQKPAAVKFRVLWISTEAAGGREAALKKAMEVYERAKNGDDFSDLAANVANDDPALKASKGVVGGDKGWMEKGEFATERVEDKVWELHPGEVTLPIDAKNRGRDGFWIAKLDEIRPGRSEPFEDERVQDVIRNTLRREQLVKLRRAQEMTLRRQAVIVENPGAVEVTMEMVMQRYRLWVASR